MISIAWKLAKAYNKMYASSHKITIESHIRTYSNTQQTMKLRWIPQMLKKIKNLSDQNFKGEANNMQW